MNATIDQTLRIYEAAIGKASGEEIRISDKCSVNLEEAHEKLKYSKNLYNYSKSVSMKEYETGSLVYSMKRKMTKLYHAHLKMMKPVLNKYPNFWRVLEDVEQNAKGFSGWLRHMKTFYHMLMRDKKYQQVLVSNGINLDELQKAQGLIQGTQQAYRQMTKYAIENRITNLRLKGSLKDLETINQNL